MRSWIGHLVLLLATSAALAQPSNSSFLHYTTDQGLSNDHILSINKDNLGFLWVGTVNGLNRFDGRTFKVFHHDPKNEHSIPDDNALGITVAPDGMLWIATSGGLCIIDPYWLSIERVTLPENLDTIKNNDVVTEVAFDSKGMAWMTTQSAIYKVNPSTRKVDYTYKCAQSVLGWYGMLIDEQDRLWMMKDLINRFDPVTETLKSFRGAGHDLGSLSIVKDFQGNLWAGTWSNGIWKFNPAIDEFEMQLVPETLAMMLEPDSTSSGRQFLWVGGGVSGLAVFYPDTKKLYSFLPDTRDPYTHNNYLGTVLYRDPSSGDIWIGTEVGLEQYAPATIRFGRAMIPPEKDMGQFSLVSGVVQDNTDETGQRYFITVWGAGFFNWDKASGKFERLRSNTQLTGGNNFNVFQDSKGNIWGCGKSGIGRYNPRTGEWRNYSVKFLYPERNNLFWDGLEDHHGNIWFCSNKEGLFRYHPETDRVEQEFYDEKYLDLTLFLNVLEASEDSLGRLWLACNASGLICYDPVQRTAKQYKYAGQNGPLLCNAVEVGKNGRIYVGCYSDFLELDANGKVIHQYDQQNGLKTNRMYFMIEDQQGKIWFNSTYLLHCYDPKEASFTYYGKSDGLFSNAMTDGLSITHSGEIFVGFQNAFNFFYPDRLRRNVQPPPIAVTSIKVMNKDRSVTREGDETFLLLKPGEDFFEVEFAALNFNQQERNQYAYQLEGFNKNWIFTDRPVATFTNLNGGTYTLHMKAANNDGVWNEEGTTLQVRVNPSFYKTTWFPILIVAILSGMAFAFLWYRRQQRKRLEKFRELLARDLHDEMGSTLSSIRFFSEYAGQQIGADKPHVTPMLQRISQSATNLSESMQDIIWAMQTDHDQLEDLTTHMMEFGFRLFEARNIKFITHITDGFSGMQLKPEVRRNVYLIFKEAVNNIAKYSEASEVQMDFSMQNGSLTLKLKDNGKGFDMQSIQAEGTGNGLNNMRKRAREIGGTLNIVSSPGVGTSVEVVVPI